MNEMRECISVKRMIIVLYVCHIYSIQQEQILLPYQGC